MRTPRVEISVSKIAENAGIVARMCGKRRISVAGVTRATLGNPDVARAMLEGGVGEIADSRVANLRKLRESGLRCRTLLSRAPMLGEADEAVEVADASLISSIEAAVALGSAASLRGKTHKVILMVELGDLGEGASPETAVGLGLRIARLRGLALHGVGASLASYGGALPTLENLSLLSSIRDEIQGRLGAQVPVVSGGNSSAIPLVRSGEMLPSVNHLRVGEVMLLGRDVAHRRPIPGMHLDAFVLVGEVLEVARKPSRPWGEMLQDAPGATRAIRDRGVRARAVVALGRQDVVPEGLAPLESGIEVLGTASDHLILDVEDCDRSIKVGDEIRFTMSYACLLTAMTSPYVEKVKV